MSGEIQNYPFEMKGLDSEETAELLKHFAESKDSFLRVGPKGFLFPKAIRQLGPKIYNMAVRPDDTWVITFPKSGTTWIQEMVWLVANNFDYAGAEKQLVARFPFVEIALYADGPNNQALSTPELLNDPLMATLFESLHYDVSSHPSPRFIKSHMPLSLLPPALLDTCRVVYVARDPRDVAVSYFYQYKLFKLGFNGDFKHFWNYFIKDMLDYTPYFENLKDAWEKRDHPNLLFLFYEDAIKDLPSVVKRVAKFLGKTVAEEQVSLGHESRNLGISQYRNLGTRVCEHLSFENFKKNKALNMEYIQNHYNKDAKTSFIRKGKAGGWRDMFGDEMAQQAERWIADNLRDTDLRFPTVS